MSLSSLLPAAQRWSDTPPASPRPPGLPPELPLLPVMPSHFCTSGAGTFVDISGQSHEAHHIFEPNLEADSGEEVCAIDYDSLDAAPFLTSLQMAQISELPDTQRAEVLKSLHGMSEEAKLA